MKLSNDFSKGLVKDFNNLKHDKDFYSFALNISPVDNIADRSTKQNERKTAPKIKIPVDSSYDIIGYQWLGNSSYVFFILTEQDGSQIWLVEGDIYNLKYASHELNFQKENVIKSTYRTNYHGHRIIYFVDGYNDDRVINIDTIELTDSIVSLSINPIYNRLSRFTGRVLTGSGNLKAGNYSVIISLKDKNLKNTLEKSQINNLFVEEGTYFEDFEALEINTIEDFETAVRQGSTYDIKGISGGSRTNKSIELIQEDVDLENYPLVDIYLIRFNETDTEVLLLEDVKNKHKFVLTGGEAYQNLGNELSDIIIKNANYNRSNAITQFNNRLVRANTSTLEHNQNFQEIANKIKVTYKTKQSLFNFGIGNDHFTPTALTDGRSGTNSKTRNKISAMDSYNSNPYYLANRNNWYKTSSTFMRDEVYALGIYFELDSGEFTDVYHIPGRLPDTLNISNSASDEFSRVTSTSSNWDTEYITVEDESKEAWKLINTASASIVNNGTITGDLGYYRTEETYPEGYGFPEEGEQDQYGNYFIRHHRMPSEKLVPSTTLVPKLGTLGGVSLARNDIFLEFELPTDIDPELKSKIKNVYFTSAKRNEDNKKVIAHGLAYVVTKKDSDNNVLRNTADLGKPATGTSVDPRYYEFISPDTNFNFKEMSINGAYIKPNRLLKSRTLYFAKINHAYSNPNEQNPLVPSYANKQGLSSVGSAEDYDYIEEFMANHSYYGNHIVLPSFKQFRLGGVSFVDNNYSGQVLGKTVDFQGAQNTVLLSIENTDNLKNYLGFSNSDFSSTDLPHPGFSYLTDEHGSGNYSPIVFDRDISNKSFYDATFYATVLTNNSNIFSDILFLEYNTLHSLYEDEFVKYRAYGDAYIENHYSKKSYSKLEDPSTDYVINRAGPKTSVDQDTVSPIVPISPQVQFINNYIGFPTTSFLNMRLRRWENSDLGEDNNSLDYPGFLTQPFPAYEAEKRSRKIIEYNLESVFKNEDSAIPMFSNENKTNEIGSNTDDIKLLPTRIVYSDPQNYESKIDSYRDTKVNNYRDITSNKGFISHLFVKDGNLYTVTRDSIFVLFASQSQLQVSTGEQISIGTGDFLSGGIQELMSIEGGYGGSSSKLGLLETPYGIMIVDILRDKIMLLEEGISDINAFGLGESFGNENFFSERDFTFDYPLIKQGISTGYDSKLHRFLITDNNYIPTQLLLDDFEGSYDSNTVFKEGKYYYNKGSYKQYINNALETVNYNNSSLFENKSKTISFDPVLKTWLSYHDYTPTIYIPQIKGILYKENDINGFIEEFKGNFIVETLFNEYPKDNKVFDSLEFFVETENLNKEIIDKFFYKMIAYNDTQSTGEVLFTNDNIIKREFLHKTNALLDISKDTLPIKLFISDWDFIKNDYFIDKVINPNSLELNKEWYKKSRLRSNYMKVRLFGNPSSNDKFILSFINANVRPSTR